ncbi:MAG: FAD:protein FMN transferase [Verrucomicrobiota bacterium]
MSGHSQPPPPIDKGIFDLKFRAMGTGCAVKFMAETIELAKAYRSAVLSWVEAFEQKYSRFIEDSLISRINRSAGVEAVEIDGEAEALLGMCDGIVFLSKGVLDPSSLPLTRLWGQKAREGVLPTDAEIAAAVELVGWGKIERRPGQVFLPAEGMAIDLGGYGKEYAVDQVAEMGREFGITRLLVDFGRDIRALGAPPDAPCWVVGVEDATLPGDIFSRMALLNRGLASSGNYRRFIEIGEERFGHILDPRSGLPVHNRNQGVTVLANTCLEAGVLSTTAFILGPKEGMELLENHVGVDGCLQTESAKLETRGFHSFEITDT